MFYVKSILFKRLRELPKCTIYYIYRTKTSFSLVDRSPAHTHSNASFLSLRSEIRRFAQNVNGRSRRHPENAWMFPRRDFPIPHRWRTFLCSADRSVITLRRTSFAADRDRRQNLHRPIRSESVQREGSRDESPGGNKSDVRVRVRRASVVHRRRPESPVRFTSLTFIIRLTGFIAPVAVEEAVLSPPF